MNLFRAMSRHTVVLLLTGLCAFLGEINHRYDTRKGNETGLSLEWGSWMGGDGISYRATVRGMVDQFTLDPAIAFPEGEKYNPAVSHSLAIHDSNRALRPDGSFLPSRSMLMPVVLVPFYVLFREYGMLLFNLLQCLTFLWLVFRFQRHFFDETVALIATLGWLADGILNNYSYNVSPDVFGSVLMLGGLLLAWHPQASHRVLVGAGVLMALSLWVRPSNAFVGIALLPAAVESWQHKKLLPTLWLPAAAGVATMLLWAALNLYWFGNPLTPAYEKMAVIQNGVLTTQPHSAFFNRPFWGSIYATFFDRNNGFFFTAPHWPLFLGLMLYWLRSRPVMALVTGVLTFVPVLLLVKYDFWNASSYGNRFMMFPSAVSSVVLGVVAEALLPRDRAPKNA